MNDTKMMPAVAYVRRETIASIFFNMGFSLLFFVLIFGLPGPVVVGGTGGFAFDFLPQFFMIALMSVLVPGWLARRQLLAGKVERIAAMGSAMRPILPRPRLPRAVMLALIAGSTGAIIGLIVNRLWHEAIIDWWPAVVIKLAAGGLVAALVTPLSLRVELSRL